MTTAVSVLESLRHCAAATGITITPATNIDFPAVNRLLVAEYGPNYPYLLHGNARPEDVMFVALYMGRLVGFARAAAHGGRTYEFNSLIVEPDMRRHGVAKLLTEARLNEVSHRGGTLEYSEPVCYRADKASQLNLLACGFNLFGIFPTKFPGIKPDTLGLQPETVSLALRKPCRSPLSIGQVHVPARLEEVVRRLTLPCRSRSSSANSHTETPQIHHIHQKGDLVGSQFIDVPANQPECIERIEELYAQGFRFSAVIPEYKARADGAYDVIRLYRKPHGLMIDFSLIHVAPPLADLKAFMQSDIM